MGCDYSNAGHVSTCTRCQWRNLCLASTSSKWPVHLGHVNMPYFCKVVQHCRVGDHMPIEWLTLWFWLRMSRVNSLPVPPCLTQDQQDGFISSMHSLYCSWSERQKKYMSVCVHAYAWHFGKAAGGKGHEDPCVVCRPVQKIYMSVFLMRPCGRHYSRISIHLYCWSLYSPYVKEWMPKFILTETLLQNSKWRMPVTELYNHSRYEYVYLGMYTISGLVLCLPWTHLLGLLGHRITKSSKGKGGCNVSLIYTLSMSIDNMMPLKCKV